MFGFMKSPLNKVSKQNSVDPGFAPSSSNNPFDSDSESDTKQTTLTPARRTSSEPTLTDYKNDFRDSGGLEKQSVQDLEHYAVYKAEETTKTTNNCLRIAEDIREDAANTLVTLHQQGEQITRTHNTAVEIDHDLSRGEKLLGSLGGMFSKTWKPKKTRAIQGPVITNGDTKSKAAHLEQKQKLGILPPKTQSKSQQSASEPSNAIQKVEVEKAKQDDALNDLSNILDDLKGMAVDMGSELERQNKALDHLHVDVEELNSRVKGANQRGRKLLGK